MRQARAVGLRPYNEYRGLARFPRATGFDQISSDPRVQQALRDLYGSVDNIEFYAGLFAEDVRPTPSLPPLIGRMVAIDAFSQAFTNPLLAPRVFNPADVLPRSAGSSSARRGRCPTWCTATSPRRQSPTGDDDASGLGQDLTLGT